MKHKLILVQLLFISTLCQAQILMEPADLPVLGTTLTVGNTVNPSVDILSPGTGLVWDFSTLTPGSVSEAEFIDILGTDGEADFATSQMARLDGLGNILGINISDLFPGAADLPATAYFSNDADGNVILDGAFAELSIPGFPGGPQALEADPDIVYLPLLQYGETLSDNGRFEIPVDLDSIVVVVRIDIERDFDVDAWGTLELPDFSHDVLRIHEISSATPVLGTYIGPIFLPIPGVLPDTTITVESYSFIAEDIGYPVATARTFADSSAILSIEYQVDTTAEATVEANFAILIDCLEIEINDNSVNATMWNWDFGDGYTSTAENPMHTFAEGGDYTVTLIASNSSTSDTISEIYNIIDCDTTSSVQMYDMDFELYPNPTSGQISISIAAANTSVYISSILGEQIYLKGLNQGLNSIDLNNLSTGIYFVSILNETGEIILSEKLLIE